MSLESKIWASQAKKTGFLAPRVDFSPEAWGGDGAGGKAEMREGEEEEEEEDDDNNEQEEDEAEGYGE